jgi:hypothetical protein
MKETQQKPFLVDGGGGERFAMHTIALASTAKKSSSSLALVLNSSCHFKLENRKDFRVIKCGNKLPS